MRFSFLLSLVVTAVGATSYWYVTTAHICPVPLSYRLGSYDERFVLPREEVEDLLREAEEAWEKAAQRDLFTYDDEADFVIDFVYEERQEWRERADSALMLLNEKEREVERLTADIARLESVYGETRKEYEEKVAAYERRVAKYNAEVAEVNAAGGASPKDEERLKAESHALTRAQRSIDRLGEDVNEVVEELNSKTAEVNAEGADYNEAVRRYNDEYGEAGAFTQGEYVAEKIVIYSYTDAVELRHIVAHELGHALGVDHIEESSAIMYYLLDEQPDTNYVATADVAALRQVCGTDTNWPARLRALIRGMLSLI